MSHQPVAPAYRLRRSSRARRARLTIDEDGRATVVLPLRAPQRMADQLIGTHAAWLDRHRSRIAIEQAALATRPSLGNGRQLLVEGVPYLTRVDSLEAGGRRSTVQVSEGRLLIRLAAADQRSPAQLLEAWLRSRARTTIRGQLGRRGLEMGLSPAGLAIRDQRSRWGSASSRGVLSFSWRLLLTPPWVLDYVVVHELAHLRVRGHGRPFWALVERHLPASTVREARQWLRANQLSVRRALD